MLTERTILRSFRILATNTIGRIIRNQRRFQPWRRYGVTVGDFLSEVKAKADGNPKTIEGYCKSFRKIVADIQDIENTPEKFDHRSGGHQRWLEEGEKASDPLD